MSIGENIRKLRKAHKLTQVQLAEKIGTRQKVIADYETAKSKPPRDRLLTLAKFFGVVAEELIGDNNINIPQQSKKLHGNKRTAKLIEAFEQLSANEQRVTLNQTQALAEKRNNGNNKD